MSFNDTNPQPQGPTMDAINAFLHTMVRVAVIFLIACFLAGVVLGVLLAI